MQIVDAQIHLWGTGLPSNPSHWQVTSFLPEEAIALMDEAGVHAAVIHPPSWDPGSVTMAQQAVKEHLGRFAIMGAVDLGAKDAAEQVASWRDVPGNLGLRYTCLTDPMRSWVADGTLDWLWAAAEEASVPVSMLATDSLADFGRIAERHPGLRVTIDHLGGRGGTSQLRDHEAMEHMPNLLALAKYPNVAVKATGAPGYSTESYPFPIMQEYLKKIFAAFGPGRMCWQNLALAFCSRHI